MGFFKRIKLGNFSVISILLLMLIVSHSALARANGPTPVTFKNETGYKITMMSCGRPFVTTLPVTVEKDKPKKTQFLGIQEAISVNDIRCTGTIHNGKCSYSIFGPNQGMRSCSHSTFDKTILFNPASNDTIIVRGNKKGNKIELIVQ